MDISSLAPAPTVRLALDHPFELADGQPIPLDGVAFVLHGHHTAESREHFLTRVDADLAVGDQKVTPSLRRAFADQRATVCALLVAVEGLEQDGRPLTPADVTPDACAASPALAKLCEQAFAKYADLGGFFDAPKASSSPSLDTSAASTSA